MTKPLLDQTTTVEIINPTFRTVVENGSLQKLPAYLSQEQLTNRAFVITDTKVGPLYGRAVSQTLLDAGIKTTVLTMKAGEQHKTLAQAGNLVDQLSDAKATRKDVIIALGGGVVGDLGGFVASIYNRGVPLVHIPTTLLAMVDSSVGGKTGVDHGGKNKTGSFYQPKLVIADPTVLVTLGPRVYTEAFGEIAKYAILDADFLTELETAADRLRSYSTDNLDILGKIIARCVKQKSNVIATDPREQAPDGRILLNYGHTLGHGLEAAGDYTELLHGEAVAIGMTFAAQLALQLGLAGEEFITRQTRLLEALGLPTRYTGKASIVDVMKHIEKDKKNTKTNSIRFVLPRTAGQLTVEQIESSVVNRAVSDFVVAQ
jgi:shikimate kinase/3-dehydroquinate synthase